MSTYILLHNCAHQRIFVIKMSQKVNSLVVKKEININDITPATHSQNLIDRLLISCPTFCKKFHTNQHSNCQQYVLSTYEILSSSNTRIKFIYTNGE